jgi:hypothetical protein
VIPSVAKKNSKKIKKNEEKTKGLPCGVPHLLPSPQVQVLRPRLENIGWMGGMHEKKRVAAARKALAPVKKLPGLLASIKNL